MDNHTKDCLMGQIKKLKAERELLWKIMDMNGRGCSCGPPHCAECQATKARDAAALLRAYEACDR